MADNTLHSLATELDETIRMEYALELAATSPEYVEYTREEPWDEIEGLFIPVIRRKEARSIQPATERPEGQSTTTQKILDGRTKDLDEPKIFATGLSFTKQKMRMGVGNLSSTRRVAQLLADAIRITYETYFVTLLNDADNAGADAEILGFDEKPPIHTGHVLQGSSTTPSNKLSVATSVTYTALNDMLNAMARTLDEDGRYHPVYRLNELWIPPEEEMNALETLKSAGRPDIIQRAENVLNSRMHFGLSPEGIKSLLYMTSDRWFGVDSARHQFTRYILEDAGIEGPIVNETDKTALWLREFWVKRCVWGWRGIYMADRPT